MFLNKKYISLAASIVLVSSMSMSLTGCGGGGGGTDSSSDTSTTSDLSGNVVDGYVSGATVTIGEYTTTTDENGFWEILNVEDATTHTIEVKGGTDVSTGEAFEGVLKAPVPSDPQEKIAVTPLSTIVASIVESGSSVDEAIASVAKSLGVSEDALTADPVERLKSGTPAQKVEAATVIKKSLVVQKMAETITKSAASTDEHLDAVFDAVMDSVAKALTDTTTEITFDEVIADTTTITESISTQLEADENVVIENLSEKLEASIESAKSVVDMVQAIDETALATATDTTAFLETKAKAIEVVTSAIEKAVESIATATDVESITASKTEAEKTTNAITMLGGVEGIESKMTEQSAKLDNTQTLDASTFGDSFLSDEVITAQSDTFDTLVESGMTDEMIAEVGIKVATATEATPDVSSIIAAIVTQAEEAGTIETGSIDTGVIETIADVVVAAVTVADDASDVAGIAAGVEEPTVEEPTVEEPTVEEETEEVVIVNTGGGGGGTTTVTSKSVTVTLDVSLADAQSNIANSAPSALSISISSDGTVTVAPANSNITVKSAEIVSPDSVPAEYRSQTKEKTYYIKISSTIYIKIITEEIIPEATSIESSATVDDSNNSITVKDIKVGNQTASIDSNGTFSSVSHAKLTGSNYNDISGQLADLFNVTLAVKNSSALSNVSNKSVTLGVLINDTNKTGSDSRFVLIGIPAKMNKNGNALQITVDENTDMTMVGRDLSSNSTWSSTAENGSANIANGTASSGTNTWEIDVASIIDKFTKNDDIGSYVKDLITQTATNAGSYDIRVFLSDSAFGSNSDDISFSNDDEDINLETITGLSEGSSLDDKLETLFGDPDTALNGYKGTLILN